MPKLLSLEHQRMFAQRLAEHVAVQGLDRVAVILHGGEPLLAGHESIVAFSRAMRLAVGPDVELDVGLQTNGLLLTDEVLDAFEEEGIAVSLSMDGPRHAHDLHRTTRRGRSSFERVEAALERLKTRPAIFAGVIAVIDAAVPAETLLGYFSGHGVPKVDFLLPDSHHERLPPGREADPELYERWLIQGFDAWLDRYPALPVRTFEAMLDAVAGLQSGTDAFGLGDVSLLSLETDGTWHDLDVLKVAGDGATHLVGCVEDTPVERVASSTQLAVHRRLLTRSGLCSTCQQCDVVDICGGGSLPHRFGGGGFDNPTAYCSEMMSLIKHVRMRLASSFMPIPVRDEAPAFDVGVFEFAETSSAIVAELAADALVEDLAGLASAMATGGSDPQDFPLDVLSAAARRAGTVAWQRARNAAVEGRLVRDVEGRPIEAGGDYLDQALSAPADLGGLEVAADDRWLRLPFGRSMVFEDEETSRRGRVLVAEAMAIVDAWRPLLGKELRSICSAIQFVRDPSAHPDKIVSFSDDSVPGALFVSVVQGGGLIDAYDLADSLIHEYRHQKLYLFERRHPTTVAGALVVSPWREDLRPASGLLHAAFVFVELHRFWQHVRASGPQRLHNRAIAQLEDTERALAQAFATLRECRLTKAGRDLAMLLEDRGRRMSLAA